LVRSEGNAPLPLSAWREFDSQCDRALVPENAKLDALRFVAGHQLFAQFAGATMRSPFRLVITSPTFKPGFCATEFANTPRTRTPSPIGCGQSKLPKVACQIFPHQCQVLTSGRNHRKVCAGAPSQTKSGIAAMVGILNANDFGPSTNISCRQLPVFLP